MPTTDTTPLYAELAGADPRPPDTEMPAIAQRLDRLSFGLDNISDAVGALLDRLQPVLAHPQPHTEDDDQPEPPADGTSPLTVRLHQLQSNAHYLADKLRAIAAALEL